MRTSKLYFPTLKENPHDAELVSHQLMLRAGFIRKLASGMYTWLPLGLKVLRKVENIVREEMSKIDVLELLMPAIQPEELWKETGRWDTFGNQLLKLTDNNNRSYCFGPTHEEVITDLLRHEVQSYKQLPLHFYQIQTKFRDEIRPRFGVMRAREFLMKDAYSFHLNQESLKETYEKFYNAYCNIFNNLGLTYRAVEADTGAIGGSVSHEFQVLAESGEDLIAYSNQSSYAANIEQATSLKSDKLCLDNNTQEIIVAGIDNNRPWIKLIIHKDDTLNPIKAAKHPWVLSPLYYATPKDIEQNIQKNLSDLINIPTIYDYNIYEHKDSDLSNSKQSFDLRNVKSGDPSPDGQGVLNICRGIEVGHIFQLGNNYTKKMNFTVINEQGKPENPSMGCYGLGISRIVAASIEQHHDEKGMCWPMSIAPFQLVIIPINLHKSEWVRENSEKIYNKCIKLGIDVLLEDRNERIGVLLSEHDLLGIPHRFIISERNASSNNIEYKARKSDQVEYITIDNLDNFLEKLLCNAS